MPAAEQHVYANRYPQLWEKYRYKNFEVLCETIEKQFPDFFSLAILEHMTTQKTWAGNYCQFFDLCIADTEGKYTEKEVFEHICLNLKSEKVRQFMLSTYIFVPPAPTKQAHLGFLEKFAAGTLSPMEPLSYVDMTRLMAQSINPTLDSSERHAIAGTDDPYPVRHLSHLTSADLAQKTFMIVNVNQDLHTMPKWVIIDNRTAVPVIFCEATLLEEEKRQLQVTLSLPDLPEAKVQGGKAAFGPSTGYVALAWLRKQEKAPGAPDIPATVLDMDADFSSLLSSIIFAFNPLWVGAELPLYPLPNCDDPDASQYIKSEMKPYLPRQTSKNILLGLTRQFIGMKLPTSQAFSLNDLCQWTVAINKKCFSEKTLSEQTQRLARSHIPGLNHAFVQRGILSDRDTTSTFNFSRFEADYSEGRLDKYIRSTYKEVSFLYAVPEEYADACLDQNAYLNAQKKPDELIRAAILAMFRGRAKKHTFEINLPNYIQLSSEELDLIIALMENNAFLSEIVLPTQNASLIELRDRLKPQLARNRWLHYNHYLPPMADDFWKQAARHWLIYLAEQPDLLVPETEEEKKTASGKHQVFKRCVKEMGELGLQATLAYLKDETSRATLDRVYGKLKPVFYVACEAEYKRYLDLLLSHLQGKYHFPFSEIALRHLKGQESALCLFMTQLNQVVAFNQIQLCDVDLDPSSLNKLLRTLIKEARQAKWTTLVTFPELASAAPNTPGLFECNSLYTLLNDHILANRRERAAQQELKAIETHLQKAAVNQAEAPPESPGLGAPHGHARQEEDSLFQVTFARLTEDASWELKRRGDLLMEVQQQQQIEQARQVQRERETVLHTQVDEAITSKLVDYNSIETLLGPFLVTKLTKQTLSQETLERAAMLRTASETLLQGLFHTWINANPQTNAKDVIKKITLEAAKVLLDKHRHFCSGISPDNLPRGFYTQRSKDGDLILGYDPTLGYTTQPNEFTLDIRTLRPKAQIWEGDCRQFDLNAYLASPKTTADAWPDIMLFSALQPAYTPSDQEVTDFLTKNMIGGIGFAQQAKIKKYWHAFLQCWQFAKWEGIQVFFGTDASLFTVSDADIQAGLCRDQAPAMKDWVNTQSFSRNALIGLGQVYYRYGSHGLMLMLTVFKNLADNLGDAFFQGFKDSILSATDNFASYLSMEFISTVQTLTDKLQPPDKAPFKQLFQKVLSLHTAAVGWESLDKLWEAFESFMEQATEMGVEIKGTEFEHIEPANMLGLLELLIACLNHIPQQEQKKAFLQQLAQHDLSFGGLPYAVTKEGFKYFDLALNLHDFETGRPTYNPDLRTINTWSTAAPLLIQRTLASRAQFSRDTYETLGKYLATTNGPIVKLLWVIFTHMPTENIAPILDQLDAAAPAFVGVIAQALYDAVYQYAQSELRVECTAILALEKDMPHETLQQVLADAPEGSFLEAVSILEQAGQYSVERLDAVIACVNQAKTQSSCPHKASGLKLAALFNADPAALGEFYTHTQSLLPIVDRELKRLYKQIFSLDYQQSNCEALKDPDNWAQLQATVLNMTADPSQASQHRIACLTALTEKGLKFKYSKNGDFRALTSEEVRHNTAFSAFVDHEERLKAFFLQHLAITSSDEVEKAMAPVIYFFKRLELNRTYLNEVEPLLASLEKTTQGLYWHMRYFGGLLKSLQPKDDQIAYPISILNVLLKEVSFQAQALDDIEEEFPPALREILQIIIQSTDFNRAQQTLLCQLALRDLRWHDSSKLLRELIGLLANAAFVNMRTAILTILEKASDGDTFKTRLAHCRKLLQEQPTEPVIQQHWFKTSEQWLVSAMHAPEIQTLLAELYTPTGVLSEPPLSEESRQAILHIMAWSALHKGMKSDEEQTRDLSRKSAKLFERLRAIDQEELLAIAREFPCPPNPTADDLLRLLKEKAPEHLPHAIQAFRCAPFSESRADYQGLAATREKDFERMLTETFIMRDGQPDPLGIKEASRLTFLFAQLKQLETGGAFIEGASCPLQEMKPVQLQHAFAKLNQATPTDGTRIQIWAILFEVMGRSTRKYPHLAQQFAIIANDIGINSPSRVLQLATGEGKSHFVALRAARHAGLGHIVDVCTAKRSLAKRDRMDYQDFFDMLGLKSTYIHAKSSKEAYENSQIHYTTAGDFSLFRDEQHYQKTPVREDELSKRVALFDEFDFIRFEEGTKTQYNFAIPTGKTPKQMNWFYQAVNQFYKTAVKDKHLKVISPAELEAFYHFLLDKAGNHEDKREFINDFDAVQLVRWLTVAAFEADSLEQGVSFTVREELIEVGEECYPMREVIPLSTDNQKMEGSTYSAGVHQLLAARLNEDAKKAGKPPNFNLHQESDILSSHVISDLMHTCWGSWEGFSGTISPLQMHTLHEEYATEVLRVPTNQSNLRQWNEPQFYATEEERIDSIIVELRRCLQQRHSILFACKDDKQVLTLKKQLENKLTATELTQLMFYTNEDDETPAQILYAKKQKEQWQGGRKREAVALIASGFGRGDNAGVEAVFLLHANEANDRTQKGGRTARNGALGTVFQFHLTPGLRAEKQALHTSLKALVTEAEYQHCCTTLQGLVEQYPDEKTCLLEEVLLCREYVSTLENSAKQYYYQGISQLSSWAMSALSTIEDIEQWQTLVQTFRSQMKAIGKAWSELESRQAGSIEVKVNAIREEIQKKAADFRTQLTAITHLPVAEFQLRQAVHVTPTLIVPQKPTLPPESAWSRVILHKLYALVDKKTDFTTLANYNFPARLHAIQKQSQLQRLAEQSEAMESVEAFNTTLLALEAQLETPSEAWDHALGEAIKKLTPETLRKALSPDTVRQLAEMTQAMLPKLQTQVIEALCQASSFTVKARTQDVLALLRYLNSFTAVTEEALKRRYLETLPSLLYAEEVSWIFPDLQTLALPLLKCEHLSALSTLSFHYASPHERLSLFTQLAQALNVDAEQHLRIFTHFEHLMDRETYVPFLQDLGPLLAQFEMGKNGDQLERLVDLTYAWWNKKQKGKTAYQAPLLSLWKQLHQVSKSVPLLTIKPLIEYCCAQPGKSWFETLNFLLALDPQLLENAQSAVLFLMQFVSTIKPKKKEQAAYYQFVLEHPGVVQLIVKHLAACQQLSPATLHDLLTELTQPDDTVLTKLSEQPELLAYLMGAIEQNADTAAQRTFNKLLVQWVSLVEQYPHLKPHLNAGKQLSPATLHDLLMELTQPDDTMLTKLSEQPELLVYLMEAIEKNADTPLRPEFNKIILKRVSMAVERPQSQALVLGGIASSAFAGLLPAEALAYVEAENKRLDTLRQVEETSTAGAQADRTALAIWLETTVKQLPDAQKVLWYEVFQELAVLTGDLKRLRLALSDTEMTKIAALSVAQFQSLVTWMRTQPALVLSQPEVVPVLLAYVTGAPARVPAIQAFLAAVVAEGMKPASRYDVAGVLRALQQPVFIACAATLAGASLLAFMAQPATQPLVARYPQLIESLRAVYTKDPLPPMHYRDLLIAAAEKQMQSAPYAGFDNFIAKVSHLLMIALTPGQHQEVKTCLEKHLALYLADATLFDQVLRFIMQVPCAALLRALPVDKLTALLASLHEAKFSTQWRDLLAETPHKRLEKLISAFTGQLQVFQQVIVDGFMATEKETAKLDAWLAPWNTHRATLVALPSAKITRIIDFITKHQALCIDHPKMIALLCQRHEALEQLIPTMEWAIEHKELPLDKVLDKVDRFFIRTTAAPAPAAGGVARGLSAAEATAQRKAMYRALETVKSIEPLLDNSPAYLAISAHPTQAERAQQEERLEALQHFYQLTKKNAEHLITLAEQPAVQDLFEFKGEDTKTQRVALMQLVAEGVPVHVDPAAAAGEPVAEGLPARWDEDTNNALWEAGLARYAQEVERILEPVPDQATPMTHEQQVKLLELSKELQDFTQEEGTTEIPGVDEQHRTELQQGLDRLMQTYDATWWPKSHARKESARALRERVATNFTDAPSYEELYAAIVEAKAGAMVQDQEDNRHKWFLTNSSGHSRFFDTLTQMQDLVLKTWALEHKQKFTHYEEKLQGDYETHYEAFKAAFDDFGAPHAHKFFTSNVCRVALRAVGDVLEKDEDYLHGEGRHHLLQALKTHFAHLPGHLRPLAKDLLHRGEVLEKSEAHTRKNQPQ